MLAGIAEVEMGLWQENTSTTYEVKKNSIANQTTMRYHFTPRMAVTKKTDNNKC